MDVSLIHTWRQQRRADHVERFIQDAALRHGVDSALVKAVVWRESRFHESARGGVGELGLMQVGALAAQEWAEAERLPTFEHEDLLDPERNTQAGTWYLAKLLRRYAHTDHPETFALADYNAGRVNVRRWLTGPAETNAAAFLEVMDFPGTRAYVRAVLARRDLYRQGRD